MEDGVKDEKLWGFTEKYNFRGGSRKTNIDLSYGLAKKKGFVVFEGRVDTPMHTMKLDALLHKIRIEVLRLAMCTSMTSLSKIAHQVWCDHPFRQGNKTTK